jgi:hypothetical protein
MRFVSQITLSPETVFFEVKGTFLGNLPTSAGGLRNVTACEILPA